MHTKKRAKEDVEKDTLHRRNKILQKYIFTNKSATIFHCRVH